MLATLMASIFLSLVLFFIGRKIFATKYCLHRSLGISFYLLCISATVVAIYIIYYTFSTFPRMQQYTLQKGVTYTRDIIEQKDYRAVVHSLNINTNEFTIALTPPVKVGKLLQHQAQTTTSALIKHQANIAINASFFSPFNDTHLFNYYPHAGDLVTPIGATIAKGQLYGRIHPWPMFVVDVNGDVDIKEADQLPSLGRVPLAKQKKPDKNIHYLLSGRSILIANGINVAQSDQRYYPRVVIGLDENRDRLWLFVVDGKQPFYSDGMQLTDLAEYMLALGVHKALELDGGGSATMAWMNKTKPQLLNRPVHTKIPNRQRPVANHLLFFAK